MVALLFAVSDGYAQPAVSAGELDPTGLWEGSLACPGAVQRLPFQLLVIQNGSTKSAALVSPSQGFATDVAVHVNGSVLEASGPMPGNVPATLSGSVVNDTWSVDLQQGRIQCKGDAKRTSRAVGKWLSVSPRYQATPMWCWLTVGEMVFEYFKVLPAQANSAFGQCQIMQTIYQGNPQFAACANNCAACAQLGGGSSREVTGMLVDFPHRLATMGHTSVPRLFSTTAGILDAGDVSAELNADRPVVIAISPSNDPIRSRVRSLNPFFPAEHVALIVGYLETKGKVWYRVNDPYPFLAMRMRSPYEAAGGIAQLDTTGQGSVSYWITEAALKSQLNWSESFLVRLDGTHHP